MRDVVIWRGRWLVFDGPWFEEEWRPMPAQEYRCDTCHETVAIGDWPFCPHGKARPSKGFEPYFDIGLGREVTGWGDIRQTMRREHLDFRDHPRPGDASARLDRVHAKRRAR